MKRIWIWFGHFWFNQVVENKVKGYITFQIIKVNT